MYVIILLKGGLRQEKGRCDSIAEFKRLYPTAKATILGFVIYIN